MTRRPKVWLEILDCAAVATDRECYRRRLSDAQTVGLHYHFISIGVGNRVRLVCVCDSQFTLSNKIRAQRDRVAVCGEIRERSEESSLCEREVNGPPSAIVKVGVEVLKQCQVPAYDDEVQPRIMSIREPLHDVPGFVANVKIETRRNASCEARAQRLQRESAGRDKNAARGRR
jgi:hypothetical protein